MIIGLSGYAKSGKDTLAQMMLESGYMPKPALEIKKFSEKLKKYAADMLGIDPARFEEQDFKDAVLGPEWNKLKSRPTGGGTPTLPVFGAEIFTKQMTGREFLQLFGQAVRDYVHEDAWVNALMANYKEYYVWKKMPNWIITDVRYENEANIIKSKGGIIVRIHRPGVGPCNNHKSEIGLDNYDFNMNVHNSGSYQQLAIVADELTKKFLQ